MDQESGSTSTGGESTLDRLEAYLSADDAPQDQSEPSILEDEEKQVDAPATEPTDKVDADDKESEPPTEYQLADVAKLLGADESALDVDEDGSVLVKTKVDGEEGRVKFADLVKSYQLQKHVDKQVQEVAEARKQAQEYAQQTRQQLEIEKAVVGKVAEAKAIEVKLAEYQGINWNALEDSDPVQAMKLQRQFGELKQAYQAKVGEINQAHNAIQQQNSTNRQAMLETERQALMNACPEWKSEAVATKEKQQIFADLKSRGYTEQDIQGLTDHKAVLLARDAMLYRAQKAASATAEKQVRQAPKIVKPGSSQAVNRNTTAIQKIHQEVRRTGSRQSVVDFLLASGKV